MIFLRILSRLVVPLLLITAAAYVYHHTYTNYAALYYYGLAFLLTLYLTFIFRGRLRDAGIILSAVILGLFVIEAVAIKIEARPIDIHSEGYSAAHPVLGWGPARAGVSHQTKLDAKTGRLIYDVDYTIDDRLTRKVVSSDDGAAVAFFGDSMTFGSGLADSDTLPQAFADATGRNYKVINLGFPGYGPQQFLRALETGVFDDLLRRSPRLFVYQTAPWHAERSACLSGFAWRAPRYELKDGMPVFEGSCSGRWSTTLKELFANTAAYRIFLEPLTAGVGRSEMDLYIAILKRAGEIAKEKYGASTLILYVPMTKAYLQRSGYSDEDVMEQLRAGGLNVIDARLDPNAFPGVPLSIPGDGHPTGAANRLRAEMVKAFLNQSAASTQMSSTNPVR